MKTNVIQTAVVFAAFITLMLVLLIGNCNAQNVWEDQTRQDWNKLYKYGVASTYLIDRTIFKMNKSHSVLCTIGAWYCKELADEMCKKGYLKEYNVFDKAGLSKTDLKSIIIGVTSSLVSDIVICKLFFKKKSKQIKIRQLPDIKIHKESDMYKSISKPNEFRIISI